MRKRIFLPAFCLLLCLTLSAVHAQQVFKTTEPSVIGYLEYLPQNYNSSSDKYPIVIFLHGIGERGVNSTDPATLSTTIQSVAKLGPPMYVKNGAQFPFILISPQLKNNYSKWSSSYVMEVINHVKTYLRIDEKGIYLTGLSLGGGGTWVTAQDHPALFAAIAPVCGGYNSPSLACNIASENLPVWAFHGDKDTTVPMSRSTNMVNAINACTPRPSPLAKMTIYPGVAHNAWGKAYMNDHTIHNPNVYEWLMTYTNTINKGNKIPVANAGSDMNVSLLLSAVVTGSGSDADGTIASYSWSQIGGPSAAVLVNKLTKVLTATSLVAGVYTFRLTVKDNSGNTDSDYVRVTVATPTTPVGLAANAGTDKLVTLPANTLSIAGSGSSTNSTVKYYKWTKVSGPSASLNYVSKPTLYVYNMNAGTYVFKLTVTDDKGATASDNVQVVVGDGTGDVSIPGDNDPPTTGLVANAGTDKTITLPTNTLYINGSGSSSNSTVRYYKWTKVSGPAASLNYVSKPTLYVYNMKAGIYVFKLTVTDDKGVTATDSIQVTVKDGADL